MGAPPANDACQDALLIDDGALAATLTEATEDGASECDGAGASPDVWFAFTSLVEEKIFVTTAGSATDTVLSVHRGCPGRRENAVTCNDNSAAGLTSQLDFHPEAGETYFIRVAGYNGSTGPIRLEVGPGGGISGTVTDELTGEPLSGIIISGDGDWDRTDLSGHYSLVDLPPGRQIVEFSGNATFLPELYDDQGCFPERCDRVETATPIEVRIGEIVAGVDFALARAGAVAGTITDAATGEPLPDTRVILEHPEEELSWSTYSDQDGSYDFRGLPAGEYAAWTRSYWFYRNEVYDDQPCDGLCDEEAGSPIEVEGGATTTDIDFALDRLGGVSGRITSALTGEPIAGASVEIRDLDDRYLAQGHADEQGFYTTEGVDTGFYVVIATRSGYQAELYEEMPCAEECDLASGTPIRIEVGAVTPGIDFTLVPLGTIAGQVVDADTTEPLASQLVCLFDAERGYRIHDDVLTDAAGRYETGPLDTGSYFVGVCDATEYQGEIHDGVACGAQGCDPTRGTPVVVEPGQTSSGIDFALERLGSISGTVTHATAGAPVPAEIKAWTLDGVVAGVSSSEAFDSRFTLYLHPGAYFITAESADFEDELFDDLPCPRAECDLTRGAPITIGLGEAVDGVDFALAPRRFGELTGTVRQRDGSPLFAHVEIHNSEGEVDTEYPDSEGRFHFTRLEPGTYFVVAGYYGFLRVLYDGLPCLDLCEVSVGKPIEIRGDDTVSGIDFVLDELPTLGGRIVDAASGEPLDRARVELFDEQGQSVASTWTWRDGVYDFGYLPPGTYFAVAYAATHLAERHAGLPCLPDDCDPIAGTPIVAALNEERLDLDFRLSAGASLSGSLRDGQSREPIEGELTLWDGAGAELATTRTDGHGRYFFGGLPTGTYFLGARAHGPYRDEMYQDVPCPEQPCDPTTGTPIEVRAGDEKSRLDFSLLPLHDQPCTPSPRRLCLNDGRFQVEARWQDGASGGGDARARMLSGDSGYFWFFNDDNVELVVKVLDACFAPYDRFWLFAAGLTDLGVELTVTDTSSGEVRIYSNPMGQDFAPLFETLASCPVTRSPAPPASTAKRDSERNAWRELARRPWLASSVRVGRTLPPEEACQAGWVMHCLAQGRFQVEAVWRTPDGRSSQARAALGLDATGFFWFFDEDNIELVVKVLDACDLEPFNSFWVYAAGLTDVEVTLRVTDTVSGETREYHNPQGVPFSPIQDTRAFATCAP